MSSARAKASSFPYTVMLCVVLVRLLLDGFGLYRAMIRPVEPGYEHYRAVALYTALGTNISFLLLLAAFSLAATQWVLERRRIAGLTTYAAAGIALLSTALSIAWIFGSGFLLRMAVEKLVGSAGMRLAVTVNVLSSYIMEPMLVVLSILLMFRLFRRYQLTVSFPMELRGRALLIFTLFSWSWIVAMLNLAMPMAAAFYAEQDIDQATVYLAPLAGSFVLVLPAFLGALLGLPTRMPFTRPVRLWLAATSAVLISAVAMVGVTYAAVRLAEALHGRVEPNTELCALVALAWFVVTIPLC